MSGLRDIGPGIVIAATGLGAGDLIAASVAGAKYGIALLRALPLVCCATAGPPTWPC
jgi:Mn2+/Fe2+ NRAMP family transporter